MDELAVQPLHDLRVLEHHLRDERAGLEVAAPLALEEIALRADDGALREPFEETGRS